MRRILPVLLPLAVLAALMNPTPAFAAEMVSSSGILSQFGSGDVARYKVAAERDAGTLKWRAVTTVWCDNSAGAAVNCNLIEGTDVTTYLDKYLANGSTVAVQVRSDYLDAANTHSKRFEHPFACEGTTLGKYLAQANGLRVNSRFNELGTAKNRTSGWTSSFLGSC